MRIRTTVSALAASLALSARAFAQDATAGLEIVGAPVDKAIGFQPAATELARDLQWLDGLLLWIIVPIVAFVTLLMIWSILRFNRRSNPTPSTFTHNSPLEVAWTVIPIVVLVFIGAFSLPVLFKQQEIPEGDVIIKVTGNQWYWDYEYTNDGTGRAEDAAPIAFSSFMMAKEDLQAAGYSEKEYLLATDTAVVVPLNKIVVMNITAADVIHAWAMPAFGVKQDAVPGRTAQLWFKAEREGVYFGQCSELCGKDHSYMPITVKVVSEDAYRQWVGQNSGEAAAALEPAPAAGTADNG
ncbi:MAG: cytochrome c oxidase subunit II [Paracoccaceae bacterium]